MPRHDGSPTRAELRAASDPLRSHALARVRVDHKLENSFRSWVKACWRGWWDTYEPTRGTKTGFPDVQVVVDGHLFPIELKVGSIEEGMLWSHEVRPAQVAWHRLFARDAGGCSILLIGVWSKGEWQAFAVSGERAKLWKHGFAIGTEAILITTADPSQFHNRLTAYLRDYRLGHFR